MKYLWYGIGALVVLFIVFNVTSNVPVTAPGANQQAQVTPVPSSAPAQATPKAVVKPKTTTPSSPSNISYGDALRLYSGSRVQFGVTCQASPNQITVINGTNVMFDNRSGDARWIALNGQAYYLEGYGFKILPMKSQTLPQTVVLDCGAAKNVGKILVQQ
ncbi:MAG: hypothetical protein AAB463_00250 [Patescibacteria group bacterium]